MVNWRWMLSKNKKLKGKLRPHDMDTFHTNFEKSIENYFCLRFGEYKWNLILVLYLNFTNILAYHITSLLKNFLFYFFSIIILVITLFFHKNNISTKVFNRKWHYFNDNFQKSKSDNLISNSFFLNLNMWFIMY